MLTYLFVLALLMLFASIYTFILNYTHLLNSLLSLEMMAVIVYFLIALVFMCMGVEMFYLLFFLVLIVCEGVLGLSLLISIVYSHGEDYFKLFNSMQC
uniref:NADH-ubiquinone oxidoreductase chain 4L n=1 Tax=Hyalella tiwanaku TaxID=2759786 RepID=A0A7T8V751_9CRUS|nr:NADH dehydrogenase subunit 4L [Hyalella tiwanaku]